MCKSVEIGKHIFNSCIKDGYDISASKIQKLLYYMQATYLIEYGTNMFNEEIVAWECGPAIKEVNRYFVELLYVNSTTMIEANLFLSDEERMVFKKVYNEKASLPSGCLIESTQKEEPWIITYNQGTGQNQPITNEILKRYFGGI